MKTQVSATIESYFRASNAGDIEGLVACFSPDATVVDEKQTHRGAAGIRNWSIDVRKKYDFKAEVLKTTENATGAVVTAKVSGNFPGSPVNLDFNFTLERDKIRSLNIG